MATVPSEIYTPSYRKRAQRTAIRVGKVLLAATTVALVATLLTEYLRCTLCAVPAITFPADYLKIRDAP